jgi:intracellular multiplication protein IcmV
MPDAEGSNMGIISGIQNLVKRSLGVEQLKQQTQGLKEIAVALVKVKKTERQETFEAAMSRLRLTEADIQKREYEFKRLVLVFSLLAFFLILYLIYLLFEKAYFASLGTLGVLLIVAGQLFRYHFWLYQIRCRKLGCSLKDWVKQLVGAKI